MNKLILNNLNVDKFYFNNKNINKLYLGKNLIYNNEIQDMVQDIVPDNITSFDIISIDYGIDLYPTDLYGTYNVVDSSVTGTDRSWSCNYNKLAYSNGVWYISDVLRDMVLITTDSNPFTATNWSHYGEAATVEFGNFVFNKH